ncbi:hypothetical protein E2562_033609 [Oryza meyeriana var. granulata]|uniref:Uncharacterized protein n=1 Tax=Oryza meyeriana var. granulata TaxID=110450 RepID=A0A6G1FEV1_9ORYZ|nr:hypothetical protein E2562_033609 [Oryza meyeriana var. granulata]
MAGDNPLGRPGPRCSIRAKFCRGLEPPSPGDEFGGFKSSDPHSDVQRGSVTWSLPRSLGGAQNIKASLGARRGSEAQSLPSNLGA